MISALAVLCGVKNPLMKDSLTASSNRLNFLDSVRGVAILMVVAIHATSYVPSLPEGVIWFVNILCKSVAVPIFFLVDGYIFHLKNRSLKYFSYIKSSFNRLIVPWLSFLFIYSCARFLFEFYGDAERYIYGRSFYEVLLFSYNSVVAMQLYFLPALFLVRAMLPALRLFSGSRLTVKIIMFAVYVVLYRAVDASFLNALSVDGGLEPIRHALWGGQFYLLGIMASSFVLSEIWKLLLPVLSIGLLLAGSYYNESVYMYLFQYAYLLSIFYLSVYFGNGLEWLGGYTMAIYLLHAPVLMKIISIGLLKTPAGPVVVFLLLVFFTCVVSVIAYKQLDKFSILKPLFGDR